MTVADFYLFIDQNPSDKVIPCLIVKIVSEELSNLKKKIIGKTFVTWARWFDHQILFLLDTNLWGADTDMTIQEIVSNFKLITSAVENVLKKNMSDCY